MNKKMSTVATIGFYVCMSRQVTKAMKQKTLSVNLRIQKFIFEFCSRLKYHFPNININYPIYDGYSFDGLNHGNNLLINISNKDDTSNNPFMNEILDNLRIDIKKKTIQLVFNFSAFLKFILASSYNLLYPYF